MTWPAILEERQCQPQAECRNCGGFLFVSADRCEPGNPNCEVHIECGRTFVAIEAGCFIMPGVCDDGWEVVDERVDGLPCQAYPVCGTLARCQPEQP